MLLMLLGKRCFLFAGRFFCLLPRDAELGHLDICLLQALFKVFGLALAGVVRCARVIFFLLARGGFFCGRCLLFFERGNLALPSEVAAFLVAAAAARQRASGAQEFAVKRDDAQAVARLPRDGKRMVERIDDERAREQVVGDAAVFRVGRDELVRPADSACHAPHGVSI